MEYPDNRPYYYSSSAQLAAEDTRSCKPSESQSLSRSVEISSAPCSSTLYPLPVPTTVGLTFGDTRQILGSRPESHVVYHHATTSVRGEKKPYKCTLCPKTFANSSYLSQHSRIHAGIRPYNCDECDRKFTQLSHLQQHLRTHTGYKPYKCTQPGCSKAFTQLSSLQSHTRCHIIDKPFKCNSCYKCFETERSLREHIPKHQFSKHSKTHLCFVCGKSYAQESYLVRHVAKHKPAATSDPALTLHGCNTTSSLSSSPPIGSAGSQHSSTHYDHEFATPYHETSQQQVPLSLFMSNSMPNLPGRNQSSSSSFTRSPGSGDSSQQEVSPRHPLPVGYQHNYPQHFGYTPYHTTLELPGTPSKIKFSSSVSRTSFSNFDISPKFTELPTQHKSSGSRSSILIDPSEIIMDNFRPPKPFFPSITQSPYHHQHPKSFKPSFVTSRKCSRQLPYSNQSYGISRKHSRSTQGLSGEPGGYREVENLANIDDMYITYPPASLGKSIEDSFYLSHYNHTMSMKAHYKPQEFSHSTEQPTQFTNPTIIGRVEQGKYEATHSIFQSLSPGFQSETQRTLTQNDQLSSLPRRLSDNEQTGNIAAKVSAYAHSPEYSSHAKFSLPSSHYYQQIFTQPSTAASNISKSLSIPSPITQMNDFGYTHYGKLPLISKSMSETTSVPATNSSISSARQSKSCIIDSDNPATSPSLRHFFSQWTTCDITPSNTTPSDPRQHATGELPVFVDRPSLGMSTAYEHREQRKRYTSETSEK